MKHLSIISQVKLSLLVSLMLIIIPQASFSHESKNIIILNVAGSPPVNDKNMTGFMDLITAEAFKRIGVILKTVSLPAERGLLNANHHKIDGEMGRIKNIHKTYKNLVPVQEKIMDWEFMAIGSSEIDTKNGWQSLAGKRVGIINGWKILERKVTPIANVTKVKSVDALFRLLQNNRVDIVIYEHWAGEKLIKDLSLKAKVHFPPLATKELFIYLHKEHAHLADKLAAALKNMKSDGTYKKIKEKTLKLYMKY